MHAVSWSSADDSFQDFMNTFAIVSSNGQVLWMFPAVVKTYCTLDVQYLQSLQTQLNTKTFTCRGKCCWVVVALSHVLSRVAEGSLVASCALYTGRAALSIRRPEVQRCLHFVDVPRAQTERDVQRQWWRRTSVMTYNVSDDVERQWWRTTSAMTYNVSEHQAIYYTPKNQEWYVDKVTVQRQEKVCRYRLVTRVISVRSVTVSLSDFTFWLDISQVDLT